MHVRLFSQMYIATQIRGGDMTEFFSYETLKHPPSLSKCGQMRSRNKSVLISCIEEVPNVLRRTEAPAVEAAAWEGSVLVNMLNTKKNQSFQTYASNKTPSWFAVLTFIYFHLFHLPITRKLTYVYLYIPRIWH